MNLIIMNFLKLAVILLLVLQFPQARAEEESYDLERIKLTTGKVYHGIQILEGDQHGLLFRHKAGIAKVPFSLLSMNLRMLYEPVADVPDGTASPEVEGEGKDIEEPASSPLASGWLIQARVYQKPHWYSASSPHGCYPSLGYLADYRVPWKSHWGPYPLPLSLANPRYRALAVRDFLSVAFSSIHSCPPQAYPIPLRTFYARY